MRMARRLGLYFLNTKITGPTLSAAATVDLYPGNTGNAGPSVGDYGILRWEEAGNNTGLPGQRKIYSIDDSGTIKHVFSTTEGGSIYSAPSLTFGVTKNRPDYAFLAGGGDQAYHFNKNYIKIDSSLTAVTGVGYTGVNVKDYDIPSASGHLPSYIFLTMYRWNDEYYTALNAYNSSFTVTSNTSLLVGEHLDDSSEGWVTIPNKEAIYIDGHNEKLYAMTDSLSLQSSTLTEMTSGFQYAYTPYSFTETKGIYQVRKKIDNVYHVVYYSIDKSRTVKQLVATLERNDVAGASGRHAVRNFKGKLVIGAGITSTNNNFFSTIDDSGVYEFLANSAIDITEEDKYTTGSDTAESRYATRTPNRLYFSRLHMVANRGKSVDKFQVFK